MLGLPQSTEVNKFVAKQKFFDRADLSPAVRQAFTDDIEKIVWANKIAPKTMNVSAGGDIEELEVFHIKLRTDRFNEKILEAIDKAVPYYILFVLEYDGKFKLCLGYKEKAANNKTNIVRYFSGGWQRDTVLVLKGNTLNGIYEAFLSQLSDNLIDTASGRDVKAEVGKAVEIQKLEKQIEKLTKRMAAEKQFNRQCEIFDQIKDSKARLQSLKNNISPVIANEVKQSSENNAQDCRIANALRNDDKTRKGQDNG